MQRHAEIGHSLIVPLQSLWGVRLIVRSHHECLDGCGPPGGLRGDEVPEFALAVPVAEEFDEFASDRPYRNALVREQAIQEIRNKVAQGRFGRDQVEAAFETPGSWHCT